MLYKNLFFDLDDTLWAFSLNARDTYEEMYWKYGYDRYFDSFEHYYSLYQRRNLDLWAEYADGKVTKEELNRQRYLYPLEAVGAGDSTLAKAYERDALTMIPTKSKLMPHAREVLEYLSRKYNLYILSNGFKELQSHKMRSSGIDEYFKKVVLSDDIGILKPWPEIFHFALSTTQSELNNSLMIGDSWENDIVGAAGVGMHQVFYNLSGCIDLPEVSLVAILDADKEGFLRSHRSLTQTAGRAARNVNGMVIMYADKITESMQLTIDETNRRRTIQKRYNEEHGITPKTIVKEIKSSLVISKKAKGGEEIKAKDIPDEIEKLKAVMKIASANLDFEKAIEIREKIADLRRQLAKLTRK